MRPGAEAMREDSKNKYNDLHWHDGTTCHGSPSLEACIKQAIANNWLGKVLRKDDEYFGGKRVSCYSLITSSFEHWAKHGTFVAVVEVTSRLL
jgi:hypothetical protein